ncbi:MAG TPA: helix-turn-helix domain-containing protein [Candidatus Enterococcus avicola]|uniref:Helix-turn-helix domain-containing protein n=1 Tax=Candidatus Enterococcus avicola TaxID=2838561 RepID=A0A9D2JI96_9ENTE|nr:helix-turn-helix domain-containing protein [Candidatus Enterococcus avicola]
MSETPNFYAIIPANVRYDKDLIPNAKLLYGEITALCNAKGYCWASTEYFAELYNVNRVSIQRWLKSLEENGYIHREVVYKEGTKEIEKRSITICYNPSNKNVTTPPQKSYNPSNKNVTENNTSNITINIDDDGAEYPAELVQKLYGAFPNGILQQNIVKWLKEWPREMICIAIHKAYEQMVELRNLSKYVQAILDRWKIAKIDTPEKVAKADQEFKSKKKNPFNNRNNEPPQSKLENFEDMDWESIYG